MPSTREMHDIGDGLPGLLGVDVRLSVTALRDDGCHRTVEDELAAERAKQQISASQSR